jgi:hypothetical protein
VIAARTTVIAASSETLDAKPPSGSCQDLRDESEYSSPVSKVLWKEEPDEHDYPAAAAYLSLLAPDAEVAGIVEALRQAPIVHQKAKDILRASGLALLPRDNAHVKSDLDKIADKKLLSPVLLVRGDHATGRVAQIADGYHRVCASYWTDENTDIPCRIVAAER